MLVNTAILSDIVLITLGLIALLALINVIISIRSSRSRIEPALQDVEKELGRFETTLRDDVARGREAADRHARETREELQSAFKLLGDSISKRMTETALIQKNQLEGFGQEIQKLTETNDLKLEQVRSTLETKLLALQNDNQRRLEKIRETVDEKLHHTLEQRLGESFNIVSQRLELVHQGLGEMQTLAVGVGDLKKVLSNVKTKGVIGEYQLGNILEQILTPDQYAKNVKTKPGQDAMVEFAVKLPGPHQASHPVWLPIDSKFPTEDYQGLVDANETADTALVEKHRRQLTTRIKLFAKEIRDKYLDPPHTTDFGIMFLPFEGLYAETLNSGLFEFTQREYRIVISGPTTLSAFLNSLQMGFRTLAIEKRSSEVWELLGAVKTEFGKFGDILTKTQKKLQEASNVIDRAGVRTRAIERKLRQVEELPAQQAQVLLEQRQED